MSEYQKLESESSTSLWKLGRHMECRRTMDAFVDMDRLKNGKKSKHPHGIETRSHADR